MSLPMLNGHQSISLGYRRLLAHTWGPARVAAATVEQHGPDALESLYEAMARRIFAGDDHDRVIRADLGSVVVDAVSEVGLPFGLADVAANGAYDGPLRASHNAAIAPMGSGVGTPIIHLGTAAFGPVMTTVPRGSEALQVFHDLRLLAGYPRLFEIKRPLAGSLELGAPGRGFVPVNIATARSS